jgi:hypothetical protein
MVTCEICGKEFDNEKQLRGHMMQHKTADRERSDNERKPREKKLQGRVPLSNIGVKRLELPNEDLDNGRVYRWINDNQNSGIRLSNARRGGWRFEEDQIKVGTEGEDGNTDMGNRVSKVVGTNPDGSPMRAYLMSIDKESYEEDQKAKQSQVDKIDKSIKAGASDNQLGKSGYVPDGGITYETMEES